MSEGESMERSLAEERLTQWRADIEQIREDASAQIMWGRSVYSRLGEIVAKNPRLSGRWNAFLDWTFTNYVFATIALAVRELGMRKDEISLRRLLDAMAREPRYLQYAAGAAFQKTPTAREIREDIASLVAAGEKAERLRHGLVGHRSRTFDRSQPYVVQDIFELLDALDRLIRKWTAYLTGAGFTGLTPTDLTDWEEVLTFPWIDPADYWHLELAAQVGDVSRIARIVDSLPWHAREQLTSHMLKRERSSHERGTD